MGELDGVVANWVERVLPGFFRVKMNARSSLIAMLFGLFLTCPAAAGSDERFRHYLELPLEELMDQKVSISSHARQSLSRAPSVVSVVTADDIKATGATNLVEALQGVPGIHIRHQPFANRPLISFRGSNNKQTLLMVNGAPVGDLMWRLGIFWKGLPTSAIERIEIIRGPGSALFGTDASAGVINVITKTAGKIDNSEVGLRIGSDNTQSASMQYGGEWNGFDLGMTVDLFRTDGHDPRIESDAQTLNDLRPPGSSASLAPGHAQFGWKNADLRLSVAKDNWRLLADYSRHDDLETGMTGAGALDPVTEADDTRFDLSLLYDNEDYSDNWGVKSELRYRDIDYSSGDGFQEWPPGYTDAQGVYPYGVINHMQSAERSVIGEVSGLYRGFDEHALTLGGGFRWQDIYRVKQQVNIGVDANGSLLPAGGPLVDLSNSPYAFAPEKSRTVSYAYVQDIWSISDDLELTAGARYDYDSVFGDALNPRVALVWQANDQLSAKLLYGEAFRAPYFQELYTETSFSLPNPKLDPETSSTWELAFTYLPYKDLSLGANLYRFEQRDVISLEWVPGLSKRRYRNSGRHTIRGLELEAMWLPTKNLKVSANYAYNDPDENEHREFGSPRHQAYLRADWRFLPDWNWNLTNNWVGERQRNFGDPRSALDDYLVTDSTLRFFGVRDWEFAVSVRNLFDVDARDYTSPRVEYDLPLSGRSVYLEARYDLDALLK